MGMLVDGQWRDAPFPTEKETGKFEREAMKFRDWVTRPGTDSRFVAEPNRYHLYVSLACPWAHRTLIVRALKGLENALPISVVDPFMGKDGWTFTDGPGCVPDSVSNAKHLYEIYLRADPKFTGRVTVPILWDKATNTIVNNESSEIIRMMNDAFDPLSTRPLADLYPEALRPEIDAINARIYDTVNNGVYKSGFAVKQSAYEEAVLALFETLDALESRLQKSAFLVGDSLTEADVRLYTTLVRFDAVYHGHFKCNLRRLVDYEALWRYARTIHHLPHVAATVSFDHIKQHYYRSHEAINPTRIVPLGPIIHWD
jgi:glutathionyl-hydroquinone reductase